METDLAPEFLCSRKPLLYSLSSNSLMIVIIVKYLNIKCSIAQNAGAKNIFNG